MPLHSNLFLMKKNAAKCQILLAIFKFDVTI